jgi:hypothetical protein
VSFIFFISFLQQKTAIPTTGGNNKLSSILKDMTRTTTMRTTEDHQNHQQQRRDHDRDRPNNNNADGRRGRRRSSLIHNVFIIPIEKNILQTNGKFGIDSLQTKVLNFIHSKIVEWILFF